MGNLPPTLDDVHDAAAAATHHLVEHRQDHGDPGAEVECHGGTHISHGQLGGPASHRHAGVVDQHIQAAEVLLRATRDVLCRLDVGEVTGPEPHLGRPEGGALLAHLGQAVLASGHEPEPCSPTGERPRRGCTDA